jgi:hypothetical protein
MIRSISRVVRKFRSINQRYATPRIAMSPAVRVSLLVLRVYLVLLVFLLLYKFATLVGK